MLHHADDTAVIVRVPVADRTAEYPVRHGPELAAGIVMMGDEVGGRMQKAGSCKGGQNEVTSPLSKSKKQAPDEKAVINGKDGLP